MTIRSLFLASGLLVASVGGAFAQSGQGGYLGLNPAAQGEFSSLFARLSFDKKAATFAYMEGDPSAEGTPLRYLAGTLPGLVGCSPDG